ncbi:MAG: hypothetical protein K0Q72_3584 [Armatimonadetes bacterium]|nr:hypothetical protein [Armatimonadota bacterium]
MSDHRETRRTSQGRPPAVIGTLRRGVDAASEYRKLAEEDEEVGLLLQTAGKHRHAIYFFVQAMEKQVRAKIFAIVDPGNPYFRESNRSHSVDDALAFLVQVVSVDPAVRERIRSILNTYVVGGIRFTRLHNDVRYPFYTERQGFSSLDITTRDSELILDRLRYLKTMLRDIERFR